MLSDIVHFCPSLAASSIPISGSGKSLQCSKIFLNICGFFLLPQDYEIVIHYIVNHAVPCKSFYKDYEIVTMIGVVFQDVLNENDTFAAEFFNMIFIQHITCIDPNEQVPYIY